jgi:DNA mismatch repair ATPase MutL
MESSYVQGILEEMLEYYKQGRDMKKPRTEVIARAYARKLASRQPKVLKEEERLQLLEKLFMCHVTDVAPEGKKIFIELSIEDINALFKSGK